MSTSSGKKIIRKVFYTTGSAMAQADKIKDGLMDIAKSFQAGYHLLSNEGERQPGQQLDGLYAYFGKIIYENIEKKNLTFQFLPESNALRQEADRLIEDVSPKRINRQEEAPLQERSVQSETVKSPELKPLISEVTELRSGEVMTRLKSVVSLSRMNTPQSRALLLSHAKDPESLVRRVIVNCINPEDGSEEAFAIVKFINDSDEDVARIAIRKSATIRNRLGFSYLIAKLESENIKLRQEAINALLAITASDLGFNPSASEQNRREAINRWQQVWHENQANPLFLIDEEATHSIVKRKYIAKAVSQELEQIKKEEPVEKKHKTKAPVEKKD